MEIIQFLIFGAIIVLAIVQQVTKSARKDELARKKQSTPVFPVEETEEKVETEIPTFASIKAKYKQPKPNITHPKVQSATAKNSAAVSPAPDNRIKLSTREEARRAFIYSEIFNRKY